MTPTPGELVARLDRLTRRRDRARTRSQELKALADRLAERKVKVEKALADALTDLGATEIDLDCRDTDRAAVVRVGDRLFGIEEGWPVELTIVEPPAAP